MLIVTANQDFARTLERYLRESNYVTMVSPDAAGAIEMARRLSLILILVDRQLEALPQLTRDAALRKVAVVSVQPPNAECSEEECLADYELGADASLCTRGYRELIARVRAIVRREHLRSARKPQYVVGKISLDEERHEVRVGTRLVELTPKEFQILHHLMRNPSKAFSREELLNHVWGEGSALEYHTLDVHIHSLRRKIEADPAHPQIILTVRGVGYKLKSDS